MNVRQEYEDAWKGWASTGPVAPFSEHHIANVPALLVDRAKKKGLNVELVASGGEPHHKGTVLARRDLVAVRLRRADKTVGVETILSDGDGLARASHALVARTK